MIKKLAEENTKVIGATQAELDQIKADLRRLNKWSQQAVKQEQEDGSKSYENNKESIEALHRTTATLRQKIKDLESPTKRKRESLQTLIKKSTGTKPHLHYVKVEV